VKLIPDPDLVAISPMTRTITTAIQALGPKLGHATVQIWPDLREAHDRLPNELPPRAVLEAKSPQFDFSECRNDADYESQTPSDAATRAERVRLRVRGLTSAYRNILLVTHWGFCTYLVQGDDFANADFRAYRFAVTVWPVGVQ
jgi:broad specificity phosphatase PhoE